MKKRIFSVILSVMIAISSSVAVFAMPETGAIKNVIYMIPDGGGMTPFYLADALKQNGGWNREVFPYSTETKTGEMNLKQYLVGAITTYCANAEITDSAASGTALSSGYKTNIGSIGIDVDKKPHATLLEAAQYQGMNAGMVTTYEWTNATPAAFAAHEKDRGMYASMSEQIVNQGIDVVLGVGFGAAKWGDISEAEIRGYNIINTREDLQNVKPGDKIWGNLVNSAFSYDMEKAENIPSLAEMTQAAITALNTDENGFFLMVEGSKIDGGGHANSALGMVSDYLAFDEACRVAFEFAKGRNDTVVVVCPDHDTGGMNLPEDINGLVAEMKEGKEPATITWESGEHTARNGGLFIYVPDGVKYPEGISGKDIGTEKAFTDNVIDNTAIAPYLAELMGVNLNDITNQLFVDVTEMGTYDEMGVFSFSDYPVNVLINASYAFLSSNCIDLDGQICVRLANRIYVPKLLLDIMKGEAKAELCDYVIPFSVSLDTYTPNPLDLASRNGRIKIFNFKTDEKMNGQIRFNAPESFLGVEPINIEVNGNTLGVYEFEYPKMDDISKDINIHYEIVLDNGEKYEYIAEVKGLAYAGRTTEDIKIDGVLDEQSWKDSTYMTCNDLDKLYLIEDEIWKGERDLSATFSVLWDDKYYYMSAIVTDEIFCQEEEPGNNMWNGDSVQFGLYNDRDNDILNGTAGTKYEKFTVAYLQDGNTYAFRHRCLDGKTSYGMIENDEDFQMACTRVGDDMIYELKMSWSEIFGDEYVPEKGKNLGFSVVINENDGGDRRGYMEYGGGMADKNDVGKFVVMPLLDFSTQNEEISLKINGKAVTSDAMPLIIDDRTMIPVRAVAENMGYGVEWDADLRCVTISSADANTVLKLVIDQDIAYKNSAQEIKLDVPAMIINDRTYIPLSSVAEAMGATAVWNETARTVEITR